MENASNTPSLRFRGYTDAWGQERLGDICSITKGSGLSKENLEYEGANKCVLYGHLYTDYGFFIKDVHWGTNVLPDNPIYSEVGDVLVPGSDTTPTGCARAASIDVSGVLLGGDINVFKHSDNIDGDFLSLSINHERPAMISMIKGTSVRHLTGKDLRDLAVKFPKEVKEQRCISSVFIKLDSLLSLHQRKLSKLQEIKKSLLQNMFPAEGEDRPKIRFAGYTDAWGQVKLGDLGEIITGSTPSTSHPEYYSSDGIPWVTPTDITDLVTTDTPRKLSFEGQKVGRVVPAETILVTCIASIGKNTMLGKMGSFNQQINALVPNKKMSYPYFLLTESNHWSDFMKAQASGGTMQIVNKKEFSEIETRIPSTLQEQVVIGDFFKQLDSLLSLHQRKLEKLQQIKKALLEQMFC